VLDQLVDHALHVRARRHLLEHRHQPLHRLQVRAQRLVGTRVLDLDGHLAPVVPHRLVHLPDARRRLRRVVERRETLPPAGPELPVEHPVHLVRRQRRRVLLQLGQRLAVRLAVLLGDRGLHHRQRLPDLHRAALELPEHLKQLLGGLVHQLGVDLILGRAGQPLAQAQCGAARHPAGQPDQLGVAGHPGALDLCHADHHPPTG